MHILMISPELAPVLVDGGIGEGVRALSDALLTIGEKVTVILPGFPRRECATELVESGPLPRGANYRKSRHAGLDLVFVDHPLIAARSHLYGEDTTDSENAKWVGAFCRGVADFVAIHGKPFDVGHAHEWPCAMVPYLLREERIDLPCVFTLHNAMHQGLFFPEVLSAFGLGPEHAGLDRLEFFGRVNFVKGALLASRFITTVSPTHRDELLTVQYGELLEGLLASRGYDFSGILNGIDGARWNPQSDVHLAAPFDASALSGKALCKAAAAAEFGFSVERPLILSLGRIIDQKGPDLLAGALPILVAEGASVLICGAGEPQFETQLRNATELVPHSRMLGRVSDESVHRLVAAADFLVMPSRYEPCGIVQMYAMRYGALPIVRRTGGLVDSVRDHTFPDGTGFFFDDPTPEALAEAATAALRVYGTARFEVMQKNAMSVDRGWEVPAIRYRNLYQNARGGPPDW